MPKRPPGKPNKKQAQREQRQQDSHANTTTALNHFLGSGQKKINKLGRNEGQGGEPIAKRLATEAGLVPEDNGGKRRHVTPQVKDSPEEDYLMEDDGEKFS